MEINKDDFIDFLEYLAFSLMFTVVYYFVLKNEMIYALELAESFGLKLYVYGLLSLAFLFSIFIFGIYLVVKKMIKTTPKKVIVQGPPKRVIFSNKFFWNTASNHFLIQLTRAYVVVLPSAILYLYFYILIGCVGSMEYYYASLLLVLILVPITKFFGRWRRKRYIAKFGIELPPIEILIPIHDLCQRDSGIVMELFTSVLGYCVAVFAGSIFVFKIRGMILPIWSYGILFLCIVTLSISKLKP